MSKRKFFFSIAFLLSLCGAVNAQMSGGGSPMVPSAPPGIRVNLNAVTDPSVSNDNTQGYQIGSLWQNGNTGRFFTARSVSTGAAIWTLLEPGANVGYTANNWYIPAPYVTLATSQASVANTIKCRAGYFRARLTISNVVIRVITTGGAGNVQVAVYNNNITNNHPGTLVASSASMSAVTATTVTTTLSAQFEDGLVYWFCSNTDTAALTLTNWGNQTAGPMANLIGTVSSTTILGGGSGIFTNYSYSAQTFGTWSDLTGVSPAESVGTNTDIGFAVQIGSIP